MIVVDSSALIAILEHESDAALFAAAIQKADRLLVSAVNVHETGIVLRARHGVAAANRMWRFLQVENDFEIIPFDETQARERSRRSIVTAKASIRRRGSTSPIAPPRA